MRIGIEAQRLFRPNKHGMERAAIELIKNLQLIDTVNEYFVFVRKDVDNKVIKETDNFKIVQIKGSSFPVWEQYTLPKYVRYYECDILHCTSNTAPLFSKAALITTIHDIIYLEDNSLYNDHFTSYQRFGNLYRKHIVPAVVKRCRKIITVSKTEKQRIVDFFRLNGGRISMIPNGISTDFVADSSEEKLSQIRRKLKLPLNFFFFLGNHDPRKNTKGTLKAFAIFLREAKLDYKLVIPKFDLKVLKKILMEIDEPQLLDKIILTGYINDDELSSVYRLCKAFLFPSFREGFGIPIIEAMACGVPVITSNISSMPEVAGGAACLVNPHRPTEIAEAMTRLITDNNYSSMLVSRGRARAKHYSWKRMAMKVHEIYKEVHLNIKTT